MRACFLTVMFCLLAVSAFAARDYISDTSLPDNEDGAAAIKKEYKIDLDGDKTKETVQIHYSFGVSDKALSIEIYKGKKKIDTLVPVAGIQANYRIDDLDRDGKKEIVIWGGLWDPRTPGEDGVTDKTYEGHSSPHRYVVATYKWIRGQYYLWDVYTTKKKYEPYYEKQPARD